MEIQKIQKQWWAPVWKGLVMDSDAKHYRTMRSAVWLYLYLLLNANRRTGILMRKVQTLSNDMGVSRDTALRWLNNLRRGGYIQTVKTSRSMTIQVTRWKALPGSGKPQLQNSGISNDRYAKYRTTQQDAFRAFPLRFKAVPGSAAAGNETKIQLDIVNDPHRSID